MAALDHTVANHLKLMEDKFAVFSSAIIDVTGVNSTLEELIANESALVKSFGDPDREPIVQFHALNFQQDVSAAIISSRRVVHAVKSIARYATNAAHIQRIKEELNSHHQDASNCQKLRSYLTVISARISNCRKHVENIQPMYEKVHSCSVVILQREHPPLDSLTPFMFSPILRLLSISACTIGVTAFILLCPLLRNLTPLGSYEPQLAAPSDGISISDVQYGINPGRKSTSSPIFILGVLCLCCGIFGLGCFFVRRSFRAGQQQVEECSSISQPPVANFQSAVAVISTFLTNMEHFKSELLYLEQSMEKAVNCENSGSIHEIEEQLQKLQVNMEALLTAASDMT